MHDKKLISLINTSISLNNKNKVELYNFLKKNPNKIEEAKNILNQENINNQNILKKYK